MNIKTITEGGLYESPTVTIVTISVGKCLAQSADLDAFGPNPIYNETF